MHRLLRLRPSGLAAASVALLLAAGGVAWAGTTSSRKGGSHVIHACVQPAQGGDTAREISLPSRGESCPKGDIPISWNERGRPGRRGAKGAAGAMGASGPQGTPGAQGTTGARGETGPQGLQGRQGETGAIGPRGATGPQGTTGEAGRTVLNGKGAPSESTGSEGDFYIDTTTAAIWGPKGASGWSGTGPTSLVGPPGVEGKPGLQGEKGEPGPEGKQGEPGISGYEVVHKSIAVSLPNNGETQNPYVTAECPVGKSVLGGGGYMSGVGGYVVNDGPIVVSGTVYGEWEVFAVAHNESGGAESGELTAVVYCGYVK